MVKKKPLPRSIEVLPFRSDLLTDDLWRMAETELSETAETRTRNIQLLRQMIQGAEDMYLEPDDGLLLAFLRARKFDAMRAAAALRNFHNIVHTRPDLYRDMALIRVDRTLAQIGIGILPLRDHQGRCVMFMNSNNWNPPDVSASDCLQAVTCSLLHALLMPATQVAGMQIVYDASGLDMRKIALVQLADLRVICSALQDALPIRIRHVHIVKENPIFSMVWSVMKLMVSKKIRERFLFHGKNTSKLQEYIPVEILPVEYGGTGPPLDVDSYSKMISNHFQHIVQILEQGCLNINIPNFAEDQSS